jgi:tetrahydromethanopterin S-methyltransferase subunit B
VDPTEHAAAVEPIKALVAQKENIGEWIRVDREGTIVEVGDAVKQAADAAIFADPDSDEHWTAKALEYDAVCEWIEATGTAPEEASAELIEQAVRHVEQQAAEQAQQDESGAGPRKYLPWGDDMAESGDYPQPVDVDIAESLVGDKLREMGVEPEMASNEMTQQVMAQLAEDGDLRKIYDIAPPAAPAVTDGGEVVIQEADRIAVDQSKAADLVPTPTNTTELQTAIDKARNEEYDEGKAKELITYGIIIGAVIGGIFAIIMAVLFAVV